MAQAFVDRAGADAAPPADLLVVGRLGAVHGIKGWLKAYSYTSPPDNLLGYRQLWMRPGGDAEAPWRPLGMTAGRRQGKILIVHLEGVDSPEQAQPLTGCELAVDRHALPDLDAGDYYWYQLQGLAVETLAGVRLGRVDHLLETGANDVLVVRGDADSIDARERLLPWLPEQVVKEVDLSSGVMRVDWDPDF